jgi:hypothetical protein
MDSRRAEPMPFQKFQTKGGKEMVRINLLPERPEAVIWRGLEKALWIFWFSLPLAIFLWARLVVNSR